MEEIGHTTTETTLIYSRHSEVKTLLAALSAASNETSMMKIKSMGEGQSANILDKTRFAKANENLLKN